MDAAAGHAREDPQIGIGTGRRLRLHSDVPEEVSGVLELSSWEGSSPASRHAAAAEQASTALGGAEAPAVSAVEPQAHSSEDWGSECAAGSRASRGLQPSMGVTAVVAITFFNVSGGPWGSEDIFSTVGPLCGTVGLLLFPLLFCIPQCLMTAELTCAFPDTNAGYSVWVREAFGDFLAVQECYWQWVSGVIDTAVYPVLICDTTVQLLGYKDDSTVSWKLWTSRVLVTALLSLPTMVSTSKFPALLCSFAMITIIPVGVFIACGLPRVDSHVFLQTPDSYSFEVLRQFVQVLFWNLEGWDCVSTCATMLKSPKEKTLFRGLFMGLLVVIPIYILTLLVAAGAAPQSQSWQSWTDGSLPSIATSVLGVTMGTLIIIASAVGSAGLYLAEFFEDAYQLQGTADVGLAPRIFSWRPCGSDAPLPVALFQVVLISLLVSFDFSEILVFDNFFTALAVFFQFAAFVTLRVRQPLLKRPFHTPAAGLVLCIPAIAILLLVLYGCFAKSWHASLVNMVAFVVGLLYGGWIVHEAQRARARGLRPAFDNLLDE